MAPLSKSSFGIDKDYDSYLADETPFRTIIFSAIACVLVAISMLVGVQLCVACCRKKKARSGAGDQEKTETAPLEIEQSSLAPTSHSLESEKVLPMSKDRPENNHLRLFPGEDMDSGPREKAKAVEKKILVLPEAKSVKKPLPKVVKFVSTPVKRLPIGIKTVSKAEDVRSIRSQSPSKTSKKSKTLMTKSLGLGSIGATPAEQKRPVEMVSFVADVDYLPPRAITAPTTSHASLEPPQSINVDRSRTVELGSVKSESSSRGEIESVEK